MAWRDTLGRVALGAGTLGLSELVPKDKLLGGIGASSNPADYQVPLPHEQQLNDLINRGIGRADQVAPQLAGGPQDQWRNMQVGQAQQLQQVASGQAKGAGELAAERQAQNAAAAQHALASMRGAGGGGQLAAARQLGAVGSTAAGMGQQAAAQDQERANQLLAALAAQGRGADIGIAGRNAELQQQQTGMNNAAYSDFIKSLMGMDQTQIQAQLAAMQAATQKPGLIGPLMSAGGQVAGAGMMASDERLKTDVSDAEDDIDAMLDTLRPKRYRYRDEARYGAGPRFGIMAQDLERSAAGRSSVVDAAEGKLVDVNKALSTALAGMARLNERTRKLEQAANVQDVRQPDAAPRPVARAIAIGAR